MTHDTRSPFLLVHAGWELFGSDRMLLETAVALTRADERVVVALPEPGPLVEHLRAAGVEVLIPPMFALRKSVLHPRNWLRTVRDAIRGTVAAVTIVRRLRPKALYVSTIVLPLWPIVGRLLRVPTVTHVHEAEASAARVVNLVLYAPHLASHRLIVNSEFTLRTVGDSIPALARRATVIPNGVASPSDVPAPREDLDGLHVVYVGRMSHRKGPDVALDAIGLLRRRGVEADLQLIGAVFAGNESYEEVLTARIKELGLGDQVTHHGFRADIWPVLAGADVVVVPSRQDESFGNTAVEGILAARPVVASDIAGLREAVGGYSAALFVQPGDAEALADALATIAADWATYRSRASSAREAALQRFAPDAYRRSVADLMKELARD
ncbi:glycosyltransferase family 4 protein [Microbacterium sp. SA39]|uniref:glycosyltransferase family 4 protein n=1 Tax=Microbacterium sp. SA39 TaxID=1263625 RepID=UPI0005F9D019|nr:glycosyltransferase family 4 protein [Microbacterium sp. SA39]